MIYRFTPSVTAYAKRRGIDPNALQDMVQRAAMVTHEQGNRRFHEWVFLIDGQLVKWMAPFASSTQKDKINRNHPHPGPGEFLVWEPCEECEDENGVSQGCKHCEFEGDRPVIRRLR